MEELLFSASLIASGLPHSFIAMHQNRYQQCIGAFILQAASEAAKVEHFNRQVTKDMLSNNRWPSTFMEIMNTYNTDVQNDI